MIYYGRRVHEEVRGMKTINVPLPDKLVAEVDNYVKSGWFTDEAELKGICPSSLNPGFRHENFENRWLDIEGAFAKCLQMKMDS